MIRVCDYSEKDISEVRSLFLEYADFLGFDLCFQGFEAELASLPGQYAPPAGLILLAIENSDVLGCVALKKIGENICEMKRLYLRPAAQGKGLGRALVETLLIHARELGYKEMKLDTIAKLEAAIGLYKSLGFIETNPYVFNPEETVRYFGLKL